MSQPELTAKTIRTYALVGAIANGVIFILGLISVVAAGISTFGCGCLLIVLPLMNLAAGIVDLLAYNRLDGPPTPQAYSTAKTSAIMDLFACFAIVPLIMGIMKLQLLNNEEVRAYFGVGGSTSA